MLTIVDLPECEKLLDEEKGSIPLRTRPTCTVNDEPPIGSSSSEKPKTKGNCDRYGKGAFNVESASSLEQLFTASPDFELGSNQLALSETLKA